jgi:hypothetical protein
MRQMKNWELVEMTRKSPDVSIGVFAIAGNHLTSILAKGDPHRLANSPSRSSSKTRVASVRQGMRTLSAIKPSIRFQQPFSASNLLVSAAMLRRDPLDKPTSPLTSHEDRATLVNPDPQYQVDPLRWRTAAHTTTQPPDVELSDRPFISLRQHLKRHAHTHQILRDFLLSSVDESSSEFRARTATLRTEQLGVLTSILQSVSCIQFHALSMKPHLYPQCISRCGLSKEQSKALRLLQDICLSALQFPQSYWITGVVRGRRIAAGGKATTYEGTYHGRPVVIRLYHPPTDNGWQDKAGQSVLKVVHVFTTLNRSLMAICS